MFNFDSDHLQNILPLMIPIIAIVMGIGAGIVAIITDFRKKRLIYELHHKERMLAIERGMELPPLPQEFFAGASHDGPGSCRRRGRYSGLVPLFVGIAVYIALYSNGNSHVALWALIPVAVGVAQLLRGALENRGVPTPPPETPR